LFRATELAGAWLVNVALTVALRLLTREGLKSAFLPASAKPIFDTAI
jgi:hypothetical protein